MPEPIFNLNYLILVRLATSHKVSVLELQKDLHPLYQPPLNAAEWLVLFEQAQQALLSQAWIQLHVQANEALLSLTALGSTQVLRFLNLKTLPKRLTWTRLFNVFLMARIFNLPSPNANQQRLIKSPEGVRAIILQHAFKLHHLGYYPTLNQVKRALCWMQLGTALKQPLKQYQHLLLNGKAALVLLHTLLDKPSDNDKLPRAEQILARLAAQQISQQTASPHALRIYYLRQLLSDIHPVSISLNFDNQSFAQQVRITAAQCETGRFGRRKVFISHVWQKFRKLNDLSLSLAQFKVHLVAAHRQGLLQLRRADLVSAMNPEDLKASEIQHIYATFHFIQIND